MNGEGGIDVLGILAKEIKWYAWYRVEWYVCMVGD